MVADPVWLWSPRPESGVLMLKLGRFSLLFDAVMFSFGRKLQNVEHVAITDAINVLDSSPCAGLFQSGSARKTFLHISVPRSLTRCLEAGTLKVASPEDTLIIRPWMHSADLTTNTRRLQHIQSTSVEVFFLSPADSAPLPEQREPTPQLLNVPLSVWFGP